MTATLKKVKIQEHTQHIAPIHIIIKHSQPIHLELIEVKTGPIRTAWDAAVGFLQLNYQHRCTKRNISSQHRNIYLNKSMLL